MSSLPTIERLKQLPSGVRTGEVVVGLHPDYQNYAELYAILRPATAQVIVGVNDMLRGDPEVWTPDMNPYLHKKLARSKYGMYITPQDMYAPHYFSVERAALFVAAEPDQYIPGFKPQTLLNRFGLQDPLVSVSFALGLIVDQAKLYPVLQDAFREFPATELQKSARKLKIPPNEPNGRLDIPPIEAYKAVDDLSWKLVVIRKWTSPDLEPDVIDGEVIIANSN